MKAAVVLNGREQIDVAEEFIICADGGYNLLKDRNPNIIVGDMDSIESLPPNINTVRHSPQKNYTDGELAIDWAIKNGYPNIVIYGALGGRIDHVLGNLSLLAFAQSHGGAAVIKERGARIYYYYNTSFTIATKAGETVSFIPYAGNARFNSSTGLKYPLDNLTLSPFQAGLGVSNKATADSVHANIAEGGVFVVHYSAEHSQLAELKYKNPKHFLFFQEKQDKK